MRTCYMKRMLILSAICIGIHASSICIAYSQVTEAQKQQWIQDLSSENPDTVFDALLSISENKVIEAIPALETNIYKQIELRNRIWFIEDMSYLKSPNASTIIKGFMDSIAFYINLVKRRGICQGPR